MKICQDLHNDDWWPGMKQSVACLNDLKHSTLLLPLLPPTPSPIDHHPPACRHLLLSPPTDAGSSYLRLTPTPPTSGLRPTPLPSSSASLRPTPTPSSDFVIVLNWVLHKYIMLVRWLSMVALERELELAVMYGLLSSLAFNNVKCLCSMRVVDQIIDNKGNGHCLLRLLRLTSTTQTPTTMLSLLLKKYDRENHYFEINGHHLNVTEDILYLTGLPIDGKAVISSTSRDKEAFESVFTSLDRNEKVTVPTLKKIVETQSKEHKERVIALLLIVIVCFVTLVCDDYIVHNYLVQFVLSTS
ncbi:hypothetical protein QVD17_28793 [Tagetes erecta]|uniref:Uncharacterized protein n=1 Tax=Tagetes erecta TaxID=13708 RepID=A0AAD8KB52_TARER|nr:hypothetical protein QVD17_28793 [Tagetes erecta]